MGCVSPYTHGWKICIISDIAERDISEVVPSVSDTKHNVCIVLPARSNRSNMSGSRILLLSVARDILPIHCAIASTEFGVASNAFADPGPAILEPANGSKEPISARGSPHHAPGGIIFACFCIRKCYSSTVFKFTFYSNQHLTALPQDPASHSAFAPPSPSPLRHPPQTRSSNQKLRPSCEQPPPPSQSHRSSSPA